MRDMDLWINGKPDNYDREMKAIDNLMARVSYKFRDPGYCTKEEAIWAKRLAPDYDWSTYVPIRPDPPFPKWKMADEDWPENAPTPKPSAPKTSRLEGLVNDMAAYEASRPKQPSVESEVAVGPPNEGIPMGLAESSADWLRRMAGDFSGWRQLASRNGSASDSVV